MKNCKTCLSLLLSILLVIGTFSLGAAAVDGAADKAVVRAVNCGSELTLEYKQTKTFDFEAENLPEGAALHVYHNGKDEGEGATITIEKATGDYTVEAKALAADGSEIASSGEIKVTVKNGLADRVKATLQNGLRTFGDAVADIFSAIYMTILVFLNGGRLF